MGKQFFVTSLLKNGQNIWLYRKLFVILPTESKAEDNGDGRECYGVHTGTATFTSNVLVHEERGSNHGVKTRLGRLLF